MVAAAIRTWLRYIVPLTALSALALSPAIAVALRTGAPATQAAANTAVALGWVMIGTAWFGQLVLVGGAAAMAGARPGQLRALGGGAVGLARAIAPCLAAAAAVVLGFLALAVPGLILMALLSLTGASPARGVAARLTDSIAAARARLPIVALAVAGMLALDAAIGLAAYRAWVAPLPRRPSAVQLAEVRHFVHAIAIALVVASPLPAALLATIRARSRAG